MTFMEHHIKLYIILTLTVAIRCKSDRSFIIDHQRKEFLKDGEPFRILSGEMHYFRVPKAYWRDRLNKVKMAGLNTVAFYIEWSSHEPEPGVYNFIENSDLEAFLGEVKDQGLLGIARAGPYICGERDNEGFPYWLPGDHHNMAYRSTDEDYLVAVDSWFEKLLPILGRHLYKHGGPIIAVQVENEYGHYSKCDKGYMEHLLTVMEAYLGKDVVYFRADFPYRKKYECDKVRDILVAGDMADDFGVTRAFEAMNEANPKPAPMFFIEYYTGWMDYWGWADNFKVRKRVVKTFEKMMKLNASVSFYMFIGGTNFGFTSGSSGNCPLTTSYDYGGPVAEHGDIRKIYHDIREIASKYLGSVPVGPVYGSDPKLFLGAVQMSDYVSLEDVMTHFREKNWLLRKDSVKPLTFEEMHQGYGFLVYRTKVNITVTGSAVLEMPKLSDRAYIRAGGKLYIFYSHAVSGKETKVEKTIPVETGDNLAIVVENMGRAIYHAGSPDRKGLFKAILNGSELLNWTMEAVPITKNRDITELLDIVRRKGNGTVPGFFHGTFTLPANQKPLDTFLDPRGWRKGIAFINGINLGRYWPVAGPQVTLYVPAPFLRPHPEENRLILFETEKAHRNRTVMLVNRPLLDANIESPEP